MEKRLEKKKKVVMKLFLEGQVSVDRIVDGEEVLQEFKVAD
jgi:hypothetical protein